MEMFSLPLFILWLHVTAAVFWIGGIIFLAVTGPLVRSIPLPGARLAIQLVGRRFRNLSWLAVTVLVVTGLANLAFLGMLENLPLSLASRPVLMLKVVLVGIMIMVKFLHDFFAGPRASLNPEMRGIWWFTAVWLGRTNLFLGLVVIYLGLQIT